MVVITLCFVQFKLPAATSVLPHTSSRPCPVLCRSSIRCPAHWFLRGLLLLLLPHFMQALLLPDCCLRCNVLQASADALHCTR
jgi:hypothetical protein